MAKKDEGNGIVGAVTAPLEGLSDAISDLIKKERSAQDGWQITGRKLNSFAKDVEYALTPFTRVQKGAIELAKAVGMSSRGIMASSERLIAQNRKMSLSMSYNISNQEMMKLQGSIYSKLGRNVAIDKVGTIQKNETGEVVNPNFDSALENLIAARQVFGEGNVAELVGGFDKLGKSMKSAAKVTGKLFQEAGEYGINLQQYSDNFISNISMAQNYNFRNGVNGLKEMARKATEIRQDMRQIASFADKVGSVTGAVETAANLQVLGGSFAALSNPLSMLNEGLTNMEGLQDRFNQMTAGAAKYNSVTHEIEMDPVTRQLMKRAADAMGVDASNLIDQAYAQARRGEISRQMEGVGGMSEEMMKLLPNIGEIDSETGVAGATIGDQFYKLSDIAGNAALQQQLIEETRSESDDIKAIAKSVMGIEDMVSGRYHQIDNEMARNKITESPVGPSLYDQYLDFLSNGIDNKAIEAVGRIDKSIDDLKGLWNLTESRILTSAVKPIAETSPEAVRQSAYNETIGLLGDNELGRNIANGISRVYEWGTNFFKTIDEYTSQYGFSPSVAWKTTQYEGVGGGEPIARGENAPNNPSIAMAARDVVLEASHFSMRGGNDTTMAPIADNGQIIRATATAGGAAQVSPFMQPLVTTGAGSLTGMEIKGTSTSVPSMTVAPPRQEVQTSTKTGTDTKETTMSYNLNLSGTLTMNVNGDNGKIGSVDLMKMIENDAGLRRELAKAIEDAIAKMNSNGLNKNQ